MNSLGFYAESVEQSPVVTLTATAMALGGLVGALFGWGAVGMAGGSAKAGALWGAGVGALAFGLYGYNEGQELSSWLKQHSLPPTTSA
jgi:hypothetical protein